MPHGVETRFRVLKIPRFCPFHSVGKVEGDAIEVRYRNDSPRLYAPYLQRFANTVRNQLKP